MGIEVVTTIVLLVVALARIIVKLTPTPKDDAVFAKVYNVLKHIGLDDTQVIPEIKKTTRKKTVKTEA